MLRAERGAARNTIESYGRDLEDFSGFCARRKVAADQAAPDDIGAYMKRLSGAGMAASTQARRLSALRQFFRFLQAERIRDDDPTQAVDAPRQARALPKYLSEDEVERLLTAARERPGADGLRATALLEVLYATGLRVSELVGLPLSALARDGRVLIVRGKGGKERMVPVGGPAREAQRLHGGGERQRHAGLRRLGRLGLGLVRVAYGVDQLGTKVREPTRRGKQCVARQACARAVSHRTRQSGRHARARCRSYEAGGDSQP